MGKENGSSLILLMGFIRTTEPKYLRNKLNQLRVEILNDDYLKEFPSMLTNCNIFVIFLSNGERNEYS